MGKLCCIFNYAPHYRLSIYKKVEDALDADFYFASKLRGQAAAGIKKLDFSQLKNFKKEFNPIFFSIFEYVPGWIGLAFNKKYNRYLITPNQFSINQWIFLFFCFLLRKKVYVWMHGLTTKKGVSKKTLFLWKLYDKFLAGSFLYGYKAKEVMTEFGFKESKMHIIYNSLDYDKQLEQRLLQKENLIYKDYFKNNNPVLLFIGRLTKQKKLQQLVDVYYNLKEKGQGVNVVFIGDGPEQEVLENSIQPIDKVNFWFTGAMYEEKEIAKYLYNADLCISPGDVGLTAIHCLSYGLPIISNDNCDIQMPEHEAIEEGVSGDFFVEDDINDLSCKIISWLANNKDRNIVRERCYKVIDTKYNPYTQVEIFKNIMQ